MIEPGLVEALNDSINRLAHGASVSDCLRQYPQHAAELQRLLVLGQLVRRSQSSLEEAQQARERGQFQFTQAIMQPLPRSNRFVFQRLAQIAATLVLVFAIFGGGAGLLAENSLPGDALYGLKRVTESMRLSLINDPNLQTTFDQRRIDEASQIIDLKRAVEMSFAGTIDRLSANELVIAGLSVVLPDSLPGRDQLRVGQWVHVQVTSDIRGVLSVREIRLIDRPPQTDMVLPTAAATETAVPTRQPTQLPPTREPQRPTPTPVMREGDQQPEATPVSRDTACDPAPPDGWIAYTIQSGDNLSTLAISSGGSVTEVAAANCMTDTRIIVVGQRIYLPAQPVRPTAQPTFAFTDEPMRPTITEQPTQGRDQSGQRDGGGNDGGDRQRQREQEQRPPANDAGGEDSGVRGR